MTRENGVRKPAVDRRQPLLADKEPKGRMGFGEVAGGTAAECAAVCCCCPCGIVDLLVLAVYKVPAGLWRKNKRRRRQRRMKESLLYQGSSVQRFDGSDVSYYDRAHEELRDMGPSDKGDGGAVTVDLEKEMWDQFYGTGFWRSASQRER